MFTKNILKAFDPDTPLAYYINGRLIEDYNTVRAYMDSGLTTYDVIGNGELTIENGAIIIKLFTR